MSEAKTKAVQAEAKQEANADIASQSGAAYVFYKKAAEYKA